MRRHLKLAFIIQKYLPAHQTGKKYIKQIIHFDNSNRQTSTAVQNKWLTSASFVVKSPISVSSNSGVRKLALGKASGWSGGSEQSGCPVSCLWLRLPLSPWNPGLQLWMHSWSRMIATIYWRCSRGWNHRTIWGKWKNKFRLPEKAQC